MQSPQSFSYSQPFYRWGKEGWGRLQDRGGSQRSNTRFEPPSSCSQESLQEKENSQSMELVLATLTIPLKEDPKDNANVPTTADNTQPPKDPKDKIVIKIKK